MRSASAKAFAFFSILSVVLTGFLVYSNSFYNAFHFDDVFFILTKPQIRDLSDLNAIWNAHSHPARFIGFLSFAINYHIHQYQVFGYHLVNWFIHIGNALLVWWMVKLLFQTPRLERNALRVYTEWAAVMCALLFVVHPVQTQAVTYITQRFASLATLFYLLSICTYLKGRLSRGAVSIVCFVTAIISALLGMFTKQIVFTLPLMIILVELVFVRRQRINWTAIGIVALFLLVVPGIFSYNTGHILNIKHMSESHDGDALTSGVYFLTQMRVLMTYLRLLFVPLGQNLDYDYPALTEFSDPQVFVPFGLLTALFVSGMVMLRKHPLIGFGILWFFIAISVESTFITIKNVIFEHRLYLPMAGFSIVLVFGLLKGFRRLKPVVAIISCLVILFSILTYKRNLVWRDGISLWTDVVAKSPNKSRPHISLGIAYIQNQQYDLAMNHLQRALELNPTAYKAYNNIGLIYAKQRDYRQAIEFYNQAVQLTPNSAITLNNRGDAYRSIGEGQLAYEDFNRAVELDPYYAQAYINRGVYYGRRNENQKALSDFNRAIQINPTLPESYNNRGIVYQTQQLLNEALADFNRAIEMKPDYAEALYNRGNVYKTQGDYDRAFLDYELALSLKSDYSEVYNNRGIIYGTQGKNERALKDFNLAIGHNPNYSSAYFNRSLVHIKAGQYQQALDDTLKAKELGKSVNALYIQQIKSLIQSNRE